MDRHEPEVGESGLQHGVDVGIGAVLIEPVQKHLHLPLEPRGGWSLKMDAFTPDRAGDDLHRSGAVIAPGGHADLTHDAAARREQRRVPSTQPLGIQRLVVVPCGVPPMFSSRPRLPY